MNESVQRVRAVLESEGISSLSDLFIAHPNLSLVTAAEYLNRETKRVAPIDLEKALREECLRRGDLHFFARVALYTALTGNNGRGWTRQHYMLYGNWVTILDNGNEELASRCWDYLEKRPTTEGWEPASIFDPILEESLKYGFNQSAESHRQ